MLNVKMLVVFLFIPLACLALYGAWTHQQHTRVVAIKAGGVRLFSDHTAEQVKQVKDR